MICVVECRWDIFFYFRMYTGFPMLIQISLIGDYHIFCSLLHINIIQVILVVSA